MGLSEGQRNRRSRSRGAPRERAHASVEILTTDEIGKRYTGEWVLLRITAYNEYHTPIAGELLAHTPAHDAEWEAWDAARANPSLSGAEYFIYNAFELAPPGATLRTMCEEYRQNGEENEPWPATER